MFKNRFLQTAFLLFLLGSVATCTPYEVSNIFVDISTVTKIAQTEEIYAELPPGTLSQATATTSITRLDSTATISPEIPQPLDTPTPAPSPTETNVPTATATLRPPVQLQLIYVTTTESNNTRQSEIWLADTLTRDKHLLASTDLGSSIELNEVRIHPSQKNLIYYVQREADRKWALWRFDLEQKQRVRITEFFPPTTSGWLQGWSANGQWLSLYFQDYSGKMVQISDLLVEVETGRFQLVQQFSEWSPLEPDQYIAHDLPIGGKSKLLIKSTDSPDVLQSIDLPFRLVTIIWQPSGKNLAATADNNTGGTDLYLYSFVEGKWLGLQEPEQSLYGPLIDWSPDGNWLVMAYSNNLYVLDQANVSEAPSLLAKLEDALVKAWLEKPSRMIVRVNNKLWLLDPTLPSEKQQIIDLRVFGINPLASIAILIP